MKIRKRLNYNNCVNLSVINFDFICVHHTEDLDTILLNSRCLPSPQWIANFSWLMAQFVVSAGSSCWSSCWRWSPCWRRRRGRWSCRQPGPRSRPRTLTRWWPRLCAAVGSSPHCNCQCCNRYQNWKLTNFSANWKYHLVIRLYLSTACLWPLPLKSCLPNYHDCMFTYSMFPVPSSMLYWCSSDQCTWQWDGQMWQTVARLRL